MNDSYESILVMIRFCQINQSTFQPAHRFRKQVLKVTEPYVCLASCCVCDVNRGSDSGWGLSEEGDGLETPLLRNSLFASLWLIQHWKNWLQNWIVASKLVKLIILTHPSWEYPCMAMICGERGWLVSAFNRLAQTTAGVYVCLLRWHGVFLAHACTYA